MSRTPLLIGLLALIGIAAAFAAPPATQPASPEKVLVTFRPKDGKEQELRQLIAKQWETLVRLRLVQPDTHQSYRGEPETGGKPVFVDIFTWLDADIPDHAPQEVQDIWKKMEEVTEQRDGHAAISILIITPVLEKP